MHVNKSRAIDLGKRYLVSDISVDARSYLFIKDAAIMIKEYDVCKYEGIVNDREKQRGASILI